MSTNSDMVSFLFSQVFELFQKCPMPLQRRLNGFPDGWSEKVREDTMARIKIISLWSKWATEENVRGTKPKQKPILSLA